MRVSNVTQMRSLDRYAIEKLDIPEELLMENAGEASYFVIMNEFGVTHKKFVIICGIGNNGGDGFVVARKIHSSGGDVKVFTLGDVNKLKGAAKKNFDIISGLQIEIRHIESIETIKSNVLHCDAIVDAIFGTGLTRNVEGLYRDVIQLINKSRKKVFSVDIPSGIHGDTGEIMGVSVTADYTVTFGLPKIGNMLFPGYEHCGKLYVSHISFPPFLYNKDSIKVEINDDIKLPPKKKNCPQGKFRSGSFHCRCFKLLWRTLLFCPFVFEGRGRVLPPCGTGFRDPFYCQ